MITKEEWESYGDCCMNCIDTDDALFSRGCRECQLYRCPACQEVRLWRDGGTDSELCDACWCVVADAAEAIYEIFTE